MRAFFLLLLAAGLAGFLAWRFYLSVPEPSRPPRVFAHYMPWFRMEPLPDGQIRWEHWQWFGKGPKHDPDRILENGRRDIASVFYPLIGPYDNRDPAVLEYHVLTARAAGIDGFIADWYGPGTPSDEGFAALLSVCERLNFRAAICLEEKSFFPGYSQAATRAEALAEMERHVRHVLDTHAGSPAYLRHDNLPVFYLFIGHQDGALGRHVLSPDELRDVMGRFSAQPFLLARGHIDSNYLGVAQASYAWCGDRGYRDGYYGSAAAADDHLAFWTGVASPGFDDRGVHGWGNGPRFTDRRGTAEYEDNWKEALARNPDYMQIVTWNDFAEGTTIEPSEEYRFSFLDLTERYVGRYTGRPVYTGDKDWGFRLFQARARIKTLSDEAERSRLTRMADSWAADFALGRRFLLAYRLSRLEHTANRATSNQESTP